MEFHSALAESTNLPEACDAVISELRRALGPAPLDLAVVFASADYGAALDGLPTWASPHQFPQSAAPLQGAR